MNSSLTPNPAMRNGTVGQSIPPLPGYSPAVPISLYREVSAELQATKASIEVLKQENSQLTTQNQKLHQEIQKAVQSALHLHQATESIALPADGDPAAAPTSIHTPLPAAAIGNIDQSTVSQVTPTPVTPTPVTPTLVTPTLVTPPSPEAISPESSEAAVSPRTTSLSQADIPTQALALQKHPEGSKGQEPRHPWQLAIQSLWSLKGWKFFFWITIVMVTAFGAGFFSVRPLVTPAPPETTK